MAYTTIDLPTDYFNTVIYTGSGSSQDLTVGFQPDFVWIKTRTGNAHEHKLTDVIRGVTKGLASDGAGAEFTDSQGVTAFNTNGFTIGTDSYYNTNTNTYVSWNWLAGGSASSNSDGSITSSVSANTTAGFSIVSYTGSGSNATVGHGLGAVPKMIFFKDRETSVDWGIYAEPNGNTKEMYLSTNDGAGTNTGAFNSTTPTSSVFTIGTSSRYNPSSKGVIAYCFANVKGYTKIGSYTGNGSLNGTFAYTGFSPAWVMIKGTNTNDWIIFDNKRNGTYGLSNNPRAQHIFANLSNVGASADNYNKVDFVSNGIKIREDNGTINSSGQAYIYMAFAEAPFVSSGGIPTTAR